MYEVFAVSDTQVRRELRWQQTRDSMREKLEVLKSVRGHLRTHLAESEDAVSSLEISY